MQTINNIIGVDLGGTNIRAGKIIGEKIVHLTKLPTPSKGSVEEVMEQIYKTIDG